MEQWNDALVPILCSIDAESEGGNLTAAELVRTRTPHGKKQLAEYIAALLQSKVTQDPQSPSEIAIQKFGDAIFNEVFNEDCPYLVYLADGYTDHLYQSIILPKFNPDDHNDIDSLCHEMLHSWNHKMRHGKKFDAKVKAMVKIGKRMLG